MKSGMRSFTVSEAGKHGSCPTKFKGGRYTGKSPRAAALKAFNQLCRVKKIRGVCTLLVTVTETTRGSEGKSFTYKCKRSKLDKPLIMMRGTPSQYKINYTSTAHSMKGKLTHCKKEGKSAGPMKALRKMTKKNKSK